MSKRSRAGCAASAPDCLANRKRGKRVVLFQLRSDVVDLGFGSRHRFRWLRRRRPPARYRGGGRGDGGLGAGFQPGWTTGSPGWTGVSPAGWTTAVVSPRDAASSADANPIAVGYRDAGFSAMALTRTA